VGLWVALAFGGWSVADDIALVRVGETWRWLPGGQAPSDPSDAWRATGFADASWRPAASGFAADPSGAEATQLSGASAFAVTYLRREFEVADPSGIRWLTLRIDYSGGFVAYLNGAEVVRRNLQQDPGSTPAFDEFALAHARGVTEEIDLSEHRHRLVAGRNCLALQWHHSSLYGYGLACVPELLGNFTRGPFLQASSSDRQRIVWKTLRPTDTILEYGESPSLGSKYYDPELVTVHVVDLPGLKPDTVYYYRACATDGDATAASPLLQFRTFRTAGAVSFVTLADVGSGNTNQHAVARVVQALAPDLVLVPGDLVYPSYTTDRQDFRFFSVYGPHMRTTPYYAVAGNHDVGYNDQAAFFNAFHLPTNSVSESNHAASHTTPESYYSFDHGDVHFVGLFVPRMLAGWQYTPESPQLRWADADLAATSKPWRILFFHLSPRTSNGHRFDDWDGNGQLDPEQLAAVVLPLARRHGVQLIISAHDHVYERFNPVDGIHLVCSAGGGGTLYGLNEMDRASGQLWARYHCLRVRIEGGDLIAEAVDADTRVFDAFHIRWTPPPRRVYAAAWNRPRVESSPADDGDGNVMGQTFDFVGDPIPGVSGEHSNPGRFHVNYDHKELHLGIQGLMLHPEDNLFVFLEVAGMPGVRQMSGLGNGVVDPEGQGADGLDFLENLTFTNFTPSVGLILGDEFADGLFRCYPRTNHVLNSGAWPPTTTVISNLALDIGQGAFRLDSSFSSIPGVRLQQFNRSPQSGGIAGEQNADFIEVSLPLEVLGLRHGDRIQLGAVVGGASFSIPEGSRELDRSFLGNAFSSLGGDCMALEGIEVQLGPDLDPDDDGLTVEEETLAGTDPSRWDTDGDGLPDGWEVRHRLDPGSALGADGNTGDPDWDGATNAGEYGAGTDPRDPASVLRLQGTWLGTNRIRWSWSAVPGWEYSLEESTGVTAGFRDVDWACMPVTATSARVSCEGAVVVSGSAGPRFYRVRIVGRGEP